jgi:hypothetical protein
MTSDSTCAEVERVIRHSEVMAVVRAMRSDCAPRIGDALDYFLEGSASEERPGALAGSRNKPYRFSVEQWHLDAAAQMVLADAISGSADRW